MFWNNTDGEHNMKTKLETFNAAELNVVNKSLWWNGKGCV